jgi:hypothetical protein
MALACASEPAGRLILDATSEEPSEAGGPELDLGQPIALPLRLLPEEGASYRIVLEYSGEELIETPTDTAERPALEQSHLLELEYSAVAVGEHVDAFNALLDGLHYRLLQSEPRAQREIEVGSDRLRTMADGEIVLDLRGAQPSGDLTPRKVLDRVFGTVRLDAQGSPVGMRPQGYQVARRFLKEFPLFRSLAYAHPALPGRTLEVGERWIGQRIPIGPIGDLGLALDVEHTLGGVQSLDGVPCAWLLLRADRDEEGAVGVTGAPFDRVVASLRGEAWVELETSRPRLVRLEDEIRAAYTRENRGQSVTHRLRYRTRLRFERRDRDASAATWTDGSERFGPR